MKHIAYLGLGTNLGDRRKNMAEAIERIEKSVGTVLRQSTFYETEPWGYESENRYLNAVVCVETVLCPLCLLKATQRIELEMGRTEKYATQGTSHLSPLTPRIYKDRPIDIDILLYDDITVDLPELKIPHPLMRDREFVMKPLSEVLTSSSL